MVDISNQSIVDQTPADRDFTIKALQVFQVCNEKKKERGGGGGILAYGIFATTILNEKQHVGFNWLVTYETGPSHLVC